MKVAYVTQPHDAVLPPRQNSIGLIIYNTALEVAPSAQVTLYLLSGATGMLVAGSFAFMPGRLLWQVFVG